MRRDYTQGICVQAGFDSRRISLLLGGGLISRISADRTRDLLHLQVYDTPEMQQQARVTDTGNIPFSLLDR